MANNGTNSMETLVDLLRERAAGEGDRLAFQFLEDGTVEAERITYAELDERARGSALLCSRQRRRGSEHS